MMEPESSGLPVSDLRFSAESVFGELKKLEIVDANVSIGGRTISFEGDLETPEDILSAMDRFGISRAVVYHRLAVENHPTVGNGLLMEKVAGQERLIPQWVLLPDSTDEFPPSYELAIQLHEERARCVRVAPRSHGYPFTPWCCGDLFEILASERIPVFISLDEVEWEGLHKILSDFSGLNVVLTDVGYRIGRSIYPLLRRFPNLFMEYTGFVIHWGLEELCRQVGPERFLFGSGLGRDSPGPPLTTLALAAISVRSKQLIAGGNLLRILDLEDND